MVDNDSSKNNRNNENLTEANRSGSKVHYQIRTCDDKIFSTTVPRMRRIIPYFRRERGEQHLGSLLLLSDIYPVSQILSKVRNIYVLLLLCIGIATTLSLMNPVSIVFAVQLTASLVPTTDRGEVDWSAIRFLTIKYPPNSALVQEFNGLSETIRFTMQADEDGMPQLIQSFNNAMATQKNSPVRIENATLTYTGQLRGTENQLSLSYNIQLNPTFMSNIVLSSENLTADVVDMDWRSISVADPLTLSTPYGNTDINYPIGLLQANHSNIAEQLMSTEASEILTNPLFNFQDVGRPMDTWHFLFDPTGSQAGTARSGFEEIGGARVVSIYSLGESSFREGTFRETEREASVTLDGVPVVISSTTPATSAQITLAGFSNIQKSGDHEFALITQEAPAGTVTATGGFPIQVLLVLGGMMGAVAVFVLIKTRK
ncbi:MAG: hypothetical protein ACRD8W_00695 [Nitrososphaeraceae archaeon]